MLLREDRQATRQEEVQRAGRNRRVFDDWPTPQQLCVLRLRCMGLERQGIADRLFLSPKTVDFHLQCLYDMWDVSNIIQAYNEAMKRGLIEPPAREEAAI